MKSHLYFCLCLLSNAFRTFDIFLFFETFFANTEKRKEKRYFFTAFFLIISIVYICVDIPVLVLMLNILGLCVLSFMYDSDVSRKILGCGFILAFLIIVEAAMEVLTGYALVCSPIVVFLMVLLYRKIKKGKENISVPSSYLAAVAIVPIFSIYMTALGFSIDRIKSWQLISIVVIMFLVTLSVFILYEKQIEFFIRENREDILESQNEYYRMQLTALQEMDNSIKRVRHDMKNHLLAIAALAGKSHCVEVCQYVESLQELAGTSEKYIATGNTVIDGVLSMKAHQAKERGLNAVIDVLIPEHLAMSDEDCTVLFGNLLDNALENAMDRLSLYMRYDRGSLVIMCENNYTGKRKFNGKRYETSKSDRKNHGLGISNMERVVKKYGVNMSVEDKDNIFRVDIILYL